MSAEKQRAPEDPRRRILERFSDPGDRSVLANRVLGIVRAGERDPQKIIWRSVNSIRAYARARGARDLRLLPIVEAHLGEFEDFARWALEWQARPRRERDAIKAARGEQYQERAMEKLPATQAQLDLLGRLGVKLVPANRREASALIDSELQCRKGGRP